MRQYNDQVMRDQALLLELGRRLRAARENAGQSVSQLARDAGLSRRHVTEAEAGRANPSILKLAQLATCLRIPLGELCALSGVSRGERLALVGLRGAGKTSVGRALAQHLEAPFVELDQRVEDLAGVPLAELFDLQGQGAYHAYEAEALEALLAEGQRVVIATGGSIVSAEATYDRLRETCNTLWLRALPEDHLERVIGQGDQRPMRGRPRALEEMRTILEVRDPLYQLCDHTIDTSSASLDEVVGQSLVWFQARMGMGERAQRVEPGK